MAIVHCCRCGQESEGLEKPPFRGDLGQAVHASVCGACWKAWLGEQTMQMNEKRLNLARQEHLDLLTQMMKAYLGLEKPPA